MNVKKLISRIGRKRLGSLLVALFVIGLILYKLLAPPSPEKVAHEAVNALENGDARELCSLADKKELTRLNLNPANVRSFLSETLWRNGFPKQDISWQRLKPTPDDTEVWLIQFSRDNKTNKWPISIPVIDSPTAGWKLVLSAMLLVTCCRKTGTAVDGSTMYITLSKKYDILGKRESEGRYVSLEQLEAHDRSQLTTQ